MSRPVSLSESDLPLEASEKDVGSDDERVDEEEVKHRYPHRVFDVLDDRNELNIGLNEARRRFLFELVREGGKVDVCDGLNDLEFSVDKAESSENGLERRGLVNTNQKKELEKLDLVDDTPEVLERHVEEDSEKPEGEEARLKEGRGSSWQEVRNWVGMDNKGRGLDSEHLVGLEEDSN